jgi:ADP-ribosylglycohydrolase
VIEKAKLQASVTHTTPEGMAAAAAAALLSHYCLYSRQEGGSLEEVSEYIANRLSPVSADCVWSQPWEGPVGAKGWMSVRAAITAVSRNRKLSMLLHDCVAFGGDVDTVAAIALGAASEHPDYEHDLPIALVYGLEIGRVYDAAYFTDLDKALRARTFSAGDSSVR